MLDQYDKITEAGAAIHARFPQQPTVGIILGSGLGGVTAAIRFGSVVSAGGPGMCGWRGR